VQAGVVLDFALCIRQVCGFCKVVSSLPSGVVWCMLPQANELNPLSTIHSTPNLSYPLSFIFPSRLPLQQRFNFTCSVIFGKIYTFYALAYLGIYICFILGLCVFRLVDGSLSMQRLIMLWRVDTSREALRGIRVTKTPTKWICDCTWQSESTRQLDLHPQKLFASFLWSIRHLGSLCASGLLRRYGLRHRLKSVGITCIIGRVPS
jgi:hypothetical protein